jgi:major membrane immunogen (membrane-anchored lipoprotein)
MAVDVTPAQYRKMFAATRDFDEAKRRHASQMADEMAPIRQRYAQREVQSLAQLEDELRQAAEPEADEPAVGSRQR